MLLLPYVEDEEEIRKIFENILLKFLFQKIKTISITVLDKKKILNIRKNSGNFQVEARDDLKTFTYVEDEEEIGADGKVTRTTRNVQIKPSWLALEGKLLTDSTNAGGQVEKESEKLGQEDLLVLEDQLDNMLDFEPESDNDEEENSSKEKKKNDEKAEESGDDEIMLIEEVKFDETESKKGSKVEKFLKGCLDSIPPSSPFVRIQIMERRFT